MRQAFFGSCLLMLLAHDVVAVEVDPAIPKYQPAEGLSGNLNSIGSNTLNNVMTFWAEKFQELYPMVNVQIEVNGGSNAPVALAFSTAQLGPMTREFNANEVAAFEKRWGYPPTRIIVAVDTLAIFVHPDNPVKSLTMAQVDSIFSSTHKRRGGVIATWGDLGLTEDWAVKPILCYGRNSASGMFGFFKEQALLKGDFQAAVQELPGSSGVLAAVAKERGSVGYSGIGYLTPAVRAVPIADGDQPAVAPTNDQILAGKYPLSRFLYLYINQKPGAKADPLVTEFIRFALSKAGQQIVTKDGYFPLDAELVQAQLKLLE